MRWPTCSTSGTLKQRYCINKIVFFKQPKRSKTFLLLLHLNCIFRIFSIVLSFATFAWGNAAIKYGKPLCPFRSINHNFRNRSKSGSLDLKVMVVLLLKILFDSCGRIVILSTCMYLLHQGQFSTMFTVMFFYINVVILAVFYSIFNDHSICSIENVIGKTVSFKIALHV